MESLYSSHFLLRLMKIRSSGRFRLIRTWMDSILKVWEDCGSGKRDFILHSGRCDPVAEAFGNRDCRKGMCDHRKKQYCRETNGSTASPGNGTVTVAHSRTKSLADVTRRADILIVAIGKERFITSDYVKKVRLLLMSECIGMQKIICVEMLILQMLNQLHQRSLLFRAE